MKTCVNCNLSYQDDKKFCKKCGAALATVYSIPAQEIAKKSVFEDRLKADPLNVDILHEFVQFLFANRLFDETIPVALKILALKENDLPALEILFQSYVKLHKLKEAIEVGKQLLQIKPADIDLLTILAEISAVMNQNEEALAYYDSALKLDPANKDMHFNKALILLKENEIEKAIRSFKEASALGNNDRITSIYLGVDKAINADYESAISQLTSVLTDSFVNPEDLNYNRGFLYLAYCLYQNDAELAEIMNWVKKIKLGILKKNHHPLDESVWISITKFLVINRLNVITLSSGAKSNIDVLIDVLINTYLINDYFTPASYRTIAEIWYNIGNKQIEIKLFDDAIRSFTKSIGLQPNEGMYKEAINTAKEKVELEQKKKKRKTIIAVSSSLAIVAIIIAAVFTFNYLNEKHTWEKSAQINTEASFQAYLDEYPEGKYKNEAISLKEKAVWNESKSLNTIESYVHYLNKYINGKYIKEAEEVYEKALWNKILQVDDPMAYDEYISTFINGRYLNEAKSALEEVHGYNLKFEIGSSEPSIRLQDIRVNYNNTEVIIYSTSYGSIHAPSTDYAFYIRDKESNNIYKLKGASVSFNSNIPANTRIHLYFDKIPFQTKKIDIIEGRCTNGCWSMYNIILIKKYVSPLSGKNN